MKIRFLKIDFFFDEFWKTHLYNLYIFYIHSIYKLYTLFLQINISTIYTIIVIKYRIFNYKKSVKITIKNNSNSYTFSILTIYTFWTEIKAIYIEIIHKIYIEMKSIYIKIRDFRKRFYIQKNRPWDKKNRVPNPNMSEKWTVPIWYKVLQIRTCRFSEHVVFSCTFFEHVVF